MGRGHDLKTKAKWHSRICFIGGSQVGLGSVGLEPGMWEERRVLRNGVGWVSRCSHHEGPCMLRKGLTEQISIRR